MAPAQARIFECGEEFELKGVARVHVYLTGEGKTTVSVMAPYHTGEANVCIRGAMKEAKFPKFKSASQPINIDYPFVLRK